AEDGIRDFHVTGVQTCALPIFVSKVFDNREFGYLKLTVERPLRLNLQVTPERIERVAETNAFKALAESKKRKDEVGAQAEIAAEIGRASCREDARMRVRAGGRR